MSEPGKSSWWKWHFREKKGTWIIRPTQLGSDKAVFCSKDLSFIWPLLNRFHVSLSFRQSHTWIMPRVHDHMDHVLLLSGIPLSLFREILAMNYFLATRIWRWAPFQMPLRTNICLTPTRVPVPAVLVGDAGSICLLTKRHRHQEHQTTTRREVCHSVLPTLLPGQISRPWTQWLYCKISAHIPTFKLLQLVFLIIKK